MKKERQHEQLAGGLLANVVELERAELFAGTSKGDDYEPSRPLTLPSWIGES